LEDGLALDELDILEEVLPVEMVDLLHEFDAPYLFGLDVHG